LEDGDGEAARPGEETSSAGGQEVRMTPRGDNDKLRDELMRLEVEEVCWSGTLTTTIRDIAGSWGTGQSYPNYPI
jgi:hypothetical protein